MHLSAGGKFVTIDRAKGSLTFFASDSTSLLTSNEPANKHL